MRRLLVLLALALAAAGCGGSHARTFERCSQIGTKCSPVGAAEAVREARATRRRWLAMLHANARLATDGPRFEPPRAAFALRLRAATRREGIRVESIVWRHGVLAAPDAVIESNDYTLRVHAGGGQWARADNLYPFEHG